jgi:TPR repeat protein
MMKKLITTLSICALPLIFAGQVAAAKKDADDAKAPTGFAPAVHQFVTANTSCFDAKNRTGANICVLQAIRKLADGGNVIAQQAMGNIIANSGNADAATTWYQKALDNPNLPADYKSEVQADMDNVKTKAKAKK